MEIDPIQLLQQSDALLLFTVLAFGLLFGKIRLGSFEIGATAGVLLVALLFGHWGFDFDTQTERLGFMLFIFSVGFQAGPRFFGVLRQDGLRYLSLAVVIGGTGYLVALVAAKIIGLDLGAAAGLLAGGLMTLIHDAGSSTWTTAVLALWAEGFLGVLGPGTVPFGDSPLYSEDSTR